MFKKGETLMSILQEYATIRKEIGEEKYSHIVKFLDCHPQYLLSDVYYRESVWNEFEAWETAEGLSIDKNMTNYYKYENVNILAFLEEKMKSNTESYQSDFEYDKEVINKAANIAVPGYKNLLWLSRKNGTHCMHERAVFMEGTEANITWKHFEGYDPKDFLAFAVEITGKEDGVIKGNCYQLDYMAHIQEVKNNSVKVSEEFLTFEDGIEELVSFPNNYFKTAALVEKHGPIVDKQYITDEENKLAFVLKEQANKRHSMKPAKRVSLDTTLSNIEKRKNTNSISKKHLDKDIDQER